MKTPDTALAAATTRHVVCLAHYFGPLLTTGSYGGACLAAAGAISLQQALRLLASREQLCPLLDAASMRQWVQQQQQITSWLLSQPVPYDVHSADQAFRSWLRATYSSKLSALASNVAQQVQRNNGTNHSRAIQGAPVQPPQPQQLDHEQAAYEMASSFCSVDSAEFDATAWAPPSKSTAACAAELRLFFDAHCKNGVCGVCATTIAPYETVRLAFEDLPHHHLLLCGGPKTSKYPRPGLTRTEFNGDQYCFQPAAIVGENNLVSVCKECHAHLGNRTLPPGSLVRFDAGLWPADLPVLTMVEQLIVSVMRGCRHVALVRPESADFWRRPETYQRRLKTHVVAIPNPSPHRLANALRIPCSEGELAETIQVVLLAYVGSVEQARALAAKVKPLQVSYWTRCSLTDVIHRALPVGHLIPLCNFALPSRTAYLLVRLHLQVRPAVVQAACDMLYRNMRRHCPEVTVSVDAGSLAAYTTAGDGVPDAILQRLVVSTSVQEAEAAAAAFDEYRGGYILHQLYHIRSQHRVWRLTVDLLRYYAHVTTYGLNHTASACPLLA